MPPSATAICAIPSAVALGAHPHPRATVGAELQRVRDEVLQQLLELRAVAHHHRQVADLDLRARLDHRGGERAQHVGGDRAELDRLGRLLAAARPRVLQQRLDQRAHPRGAVDGVAR